MVYHLAISTSIRFIIGLITHIVAFPTAYLSNTNLVSAMANPTIPCCSSFCWLHLQSSSHNPIIPTMIQLFIQFIPNYPIFPWERTPVSRSIYLRAKLRRGRRGRSSATGRLHTKSSPALRSPLRRRSLRRGGSPPGRHLFVRSEFLAISHHSSDVSTKGHYKWI